MTTKQEQLQERMADVIQGRKAVDKAAFQPSLSDDLKKFWQKLSKP
ncbi:MAG: hypothetical protein AAF329_02770 [Cyanobacteria bacterium P01_A01_bin.17]